MGSFHLHISLRHFQSTFLFISSPHVPSIAFHVTSTFPRRGSHLLTICFHLHISLRHFRSTFLFISQPHVSSIAFHFTSTCPFNSISFHIHISTSGVTHLNHFLS